MLAKRRTSAGKTKTGQKMFRIDPLVSVDGFTIRLASAKTKPTESKIDNLQEVARKLVAPARSSLSSPYRTQQFRYESSSVVASLKN